MILKVGKSYKLKASPCGGWPEQIVKVTFMGHMYAQILYVDQHSVTRVHALEIAAAGQYLSEIPQPASDVERVEPVVGECGPLFGDGLGDRDRFRRVFATWDFGSFA